jgi:hypothetical protein
MDAVIHLAWDRVSKKSEAMLTKPELSFSLGWSGCGRGDIKDVDAGKMKDLEQRVTTMLMVCNV